MAQPEPMDPRTLASDAADEVVGVLLRVFPEFPGSQAVGADDRSRIAALLHRRTVEAALRVGQIYGCGDPIVGVAVWLPRPPITETEPSPRPPGPSLREQLPDSVIEALGWFDVAMQRLRAVSRPDRHMYLDMLGVLPGHRRRGIATALMDAGHAWADGLGLPCALDTTSEDNVAFYERRNYRVMARERLSGAGYDLVAMRRHQP